MRIDHIAVAVRSVDSAADKLTALLGYARKTTKVTNSAQRVTVLFLEKEQSVDIKLIEPSDPQSPLWEHIRKGGGLHHVAFKVADVPSACEALAAGGARVLSPPAPGEAFNDHLIAFCYVGSGLNIELIDTDERAGAIVKEP
jgi:methylmalonyl-CoA/ethylmalonyl-CoA epimerase